jgi:hypothetical protein
MKPARASVVVVAVAMSKESKMGRLFTYTLFASGMCALMLWAGQGNAAEPCRVAKGSSPIAAACAEGGLLRAKQSMRAMVKQARAAGGRFDCEDCHADTDHYDKLAPDAERKFAKLLALAAGAK